MRDFKHFWKITIGGAALVGVFLIAATSHPSTQAAAPAKPAAIQSAWVVEMTPIVPAGSMGGASLDSANKTDW